MNRLVLRILFVTAVLLLSSCAPKAVVPIPVLEYAGPDVVGSRNFLILLRGIGGDPEDFEKYGLVAEVRKRDLPFDIAVPDAHFGYYKARNLEERLKYDIIDPARAKGYQNIWLAGFSMGGMGALFYLRSYPGDVDGVIISSPFLGWSSILWEIEKAGGVATWSPSIKKRDNWQYILWSWIKEYNLSNGNYPPIYLGYGTDDEMTGQGPRLLAEVLEKDNVFTVAGGHGYGIFKKIWELHLTRLEERFRKLPP